MDERLDGQWSRHKNDEQLIQSLGTVSGPITCVSLPQKDLCVYSQGSGLVRERLNSSSGGNKKDHIPIFPNGTLVHGMQHSNSYTAAFGGRHVALLRNVKPSQEERETWEPMQLVSQIQQQSSNEISSNFLTCSDWIWNVQWVVNHNNNANDGDNLLCVGLAHNSVELWSFLPASNNTAQEPQKSNSVQVTRRQTWRGAKRCLTYCLDFDYCGDGGLSIAVGTAMQDIRVWRVPPNSMTTAISSHDQGATVVEIAEEACLLGHQGVIHNIKWVPSSSSSQLVSASDDRSIRLWKRSNNDNGQDGWDCAWTGWGHTARIWGLEILQQQNNIDGDDAATMIVSTGEDGTARLWEAQTGEQLCILRGHSCHCIWSVDTANNSADGGSRIVTGANDGTIALYNIAAKDFANKDKTQADDDNDGYHNTIDGTQQNTFLLPDDRPEKTEDEKSAIVISNTMTEEDHVETRKKKKKKKPEPGQVVFDMKFYTPDRLLVATRSGNLFSVNTTSGPVSNEAWCSLGSWASSSTSNDDGAMVNDVHIDSAMGCSMSCHLDKEEKKLWVAVGTTRGEIVVLTIPVNVSPEIALRDTKTFGQRIVLQPPKEYRSVQGLAWLPTNPQSSDHPLRTLVSFHIDTVLGWYLPNISLTDASQQPKWELEIGTKAIPISFACNEEYSRLFVGDTRGNLAVFAVDEIPKDDEDTRGMGDNDDSDKGANAIHNRRKPLDMITRLHGKEHVTGISVVPISVDKKLHTGLTSHRRIVSVGNDGCIIETYFNVQTGKLLNGTSVNASSALTGIAQVWVVLSAREENVIVAGYYGNTLVVLNVSRGYELFRADTGGRQRLSDYWSGLLHDPAKADESATTTTTALHNLAICSHRKKDGRNEIIFHTKKGTKDDKGIDTFWKQHQYAAGLGLHGETIYSASFFPCYIDHGGSHVWALVTGSEDCGSRISIFKGDSLTTSKRLPPQESCVRAVCSTTYTTHNQNITTLVAVGGGKLMLQFFVVTADPQGKSVGAADTVVRFIGNGKTNQKACIDHRINSLKSVLLDQSSGAENGFQEQTAPKVVVAAGDSQGDCHIYLVDMEKNGSKTHSWMGLPVPKPLVMRKPILSVEMVKVKSSLLLTVGTTGGDIELWELPSDSSAEEWEALDPITRHTKNIETFPARQLGQFHAHQMGVNSIAARTLQSSPETLFICSGGDDQAITLCEFHLEFYNDDNGTRVKAAVVRGTMTLKEASSSAIKEVRLLDYNHILSVGYSQRLALWKREVIADTDTDTEAEESQSNKTELKLLWTSPASVGDVSCMACTQNAGGERIVAVCGAGVHLFCLKNY